MRVRARHIHLLEGFIDNCVGWVMNVAAIILIYNGMFGHNILWSENVIGGIIMFFIAWGRKYTIRRWSNRFIAKMYKKYELQEQAGED